jgi:hypothetical protein
MSEPKIVDVVNMPQGNEAFELRRSRFADVVISHSAAIFSVPKCGTMLLRNIMYMHFEIKAWHEPFVESWTLHEAFARAQHENIICTGHIDFLPESVKFSRGFKRLLLVRDPADYVLSYARFLLSNDFQTQSNLGRTIRDSGFTLAEAIRVAILGIHSDGAMIPDVLQQFTRKALAWASLDSLLVRYEDLLAAALEPDQPGSRAYFERMLSFLGISVPSDIVERVRAGADRTISTTARENLTFSGAPASRDRLNADELRLLETVAPGLRRTLGYN